MKTKTNKHLISQKRVCQCIQHIKVPTEAAAGPDLEMRRGRSSRPRDKRGRGGLKKFFGGSKNKRGGGSPGSASVSTLIFDVSYWRGDHYMVTQATQRSKAVYVSSFLSYFKTQSIGLVLGIEPETSRSTVKCSND